MARAESPTVQRLQLGVQLRRHREDRGLTATEAAEALEVDVSQISRLETAKRRPTVMFVRALCRLYGLDEHVTEQLLELTRRSREEGWWQGHGLGATMSTYLGLESAAEGVKSVELTVFPGLLQTAQYAEALARTDPGQTEEDVRRQVTIRLARQGILRHESPLRLHVIVDEGVLHRTVGGPEIMREQLSYVTQTAQLPHVVVQVLPFAVTPPSALAGTFTVLRFGEPIMNDIVYVDGPLGTMFQSKQDDVDRCDRLFDELARLALDEAASLALIDSWIKRLT